MTAFSRPIGSSLVGSKAYIAAGLGQYNYDRIDKAVLGCFGCGVPDY